MSNPLASSNSNKFPHSQPKTSRQSHNMGQHPDATPGQNLPAGIVTFLFTDIEGSTQHWEQNPEAMQMALSRHDTILLQAIQQHGGNAFKRVGDAFQAVFQHASDALNAALAAQRALHTEPWVSTPLKVRMALHTGEAEPRAGDYLTPLLNRLARILAAGHGGQTLLSAATFELVKEHLPPSIELRDMGERRLRDIIRSEHIYQLLAPDLPSQFPPLKTLDSFRTNLPAPLTSFIGREKEIVEIKHLMARSRLVTLTGVGGAGKTRLSLQIAADLLDSFLDGVWFVEFASLTDASLVPQITSVALDLYESTDLHPIERLKGYLREKKVLLIIDNCEHLLDALASMIVTLLQTCPNLSILATSRELLDVPGEIPYQVPPLSFPETQDSLSTEAVVQFESVRLFVERAQTAMPFFTLTDEDATSLAQICSHLDGIPLAIELAAARIRILTIPQITELLNDRFRLLTGGSRAVLPRQQTLRALIDWSHDLLSDAEQALLRRLSVFAGGWTIEAADAVCRELGMNDTNTFDLLTHLVNKSLIIADVTSEAEPRYRMLETIRQYAHEKLANMDDELSVARDRHMQYFLIVAEHAEQEMNGPNIVEWLRRLEIELDNLHAALDWSSTRNVEVGLQLASALLEFWQQSGYASIGRSWLTQLLEQPDTQQCSFAKAKALRTLGHLFLRGRNTYPNRSQKVISMLKESISISEELQDRKGTAFSLLLLGLLHYFRDLSGHRQGKLESLQALKIYQDIGDEFGIASALVTLGGCFYREKNNVIRANRVEKGAKIFQKLQYLPGIAHSFMHMGELAIARMDYLSARSHFEYALATQRLLGKGMYSISILTPLINLELQDENYAKARAYVDESLLIIGPERNNHHFWPWVMVQLAYINLREGYIMDAKKLFRENLFFFNQSKDSIGIIYSIEGLASLSVQQSLHKYAACLFSWTNLAREQIENHRPKLEQANVDRDLAVIRAQLDEPTFTAAQAAGRVMTMDEAVAYALRDE